MRKSQLAVTVWMALWSAGAQAAAKESKAAGEPVRHLVAAFSSQFRHVYATKDSGTLSDDHTKLFYDPEHQVLRVLEPERKARTIKPVRVRNEKGKFSSATFKIAGQQILIISSENDGYEARIRNPASGLDVDLQEKNVEAELSAE